MIVAFSGWRRWSDAAFVQRTIDDLFGRHAMFGPREVPIHVRVGDAEGVDAIVRHHVAGMDGAVLAMYTADWSGHGRSAGAIRNRHMLLGEDAWDPTAGKHAELLVAFPEPGKVWMGKGSGTWNCIGQAHMRGIEVRIPGYWVAEPAEAESLFTVAHPGGDS